MGFVDVFKGAWLGEGELFAEGREVFGKFGVVEDLEKSFVVYFFVGTVELLSSENVG